jgi:dipeptidyl aminopeptidase/acylaminoacyl peptidase
MSAKQLELSVARLAKIGACWSPSFSPDGQQIAFVSDLNGIPQVWTVPAEGGWPTLVTALDDPISAVNWSPDDRWLAFNLAPGGGMNRQVYLICSDGTDLRLLTEGGKDNNWLGFWTHDGKALVISSSRRTPEAMDAYLIDPTSGALRLAATNQGIGALTDVSRDGRFALLHRVAHRSDSNLFLIDLQTGRELLLTPHQGPGNFTDARFSPDGKTIYLTSDRDREQVAFARVKVKSNGEPGSIEVIAGRDDAQLQEFALTDDGTTAALVWNIAGKSELVFLDLLTLKSLPGPELPAEIIFNLSFSKNGRRLALVATGAAMPRDVWVVERQSSRIWQVTHSPHAGVNLDELVGPELVYFPAHDGLELSGWLYEPPHVAPPYPTVLSFHGGPEGQERPRFTSIYQALLAQGIAVFAPNVRGSSGFGKTFVNLDNGALRVDALRDIKACVDYVTQAGVADPKRMGIMGGSYGGYMTMAGLSEYPDVFAAGANLFGVVNFKTFFANTEPWMAAISKVEYGDPETEGDLLDSLSPIHKIDRVKAATIVLHGANDTNVPVVEAEQVVAQLQQRGVPVEYVLFPDEGHGFLKQPNRIQSDVAIVEWFTRYLKTP